MGHAPYLCTHSEKTKMKSEIANIQGNGVEHAPTCPAPATWPPPWLVEAAGEPPAVALPPVPATTCPEVPPVAVQPAGDGWESAIEPPPPCPTCGSLELWQDILGGWHCQHCDGATLRRSLALLERAARLRRFREHRKMGET